MERLCRRCLLSRRATARNHARRETDESHKEAHTICLKLLVLFCGSLLLDDVCTNAFCLESRSALMVDQAHDQPRQAAGAWGQPARRESNFCESGVARVERVS